MKVGLAGVFALGIIALAGCGTGGYSNPPANKPPATNPPTTDSSPTAAAGAVVKAAVPKPITLKLGQTSLGPTLTFNGWTVYRFESDSNKPPTSACQGPCLASWPPLLTDGTPVQVDESIDSAKVGVLVRPDGTSQVTLNGWPLYLFAKDTQRGDVKGEGVGGKWSAVDATGKAIRKK